ncbi:MAG: transposase, partial [Armatimonadetes bacterium]|nr:transposase [Armatimonadota bacterium]
MITPSEDIIHLWATFAGAMTAPTFANALVLLDGTILAPGRRTVTAALRVLGLTEGSTFGKYHRVLSRAQWSPMVLSRLLLGLLVKTFVAEDAPLVLVIDETLERRCGKQIVYRGRFDDAVRSTAQRGAVTSGIRWSCLCLLVTVPWSGRLWALPFLVVPVLSEKTCQKLKKTHRSGTQWAAWMLAKVRRWVPGRQIVLVGDGEYATVELIRASQQGAGLLVGRLRWDASLWAFPDPQPPSKRGRKPKKGARLPSLRQRLDDPATLWQPATFTWYGGAAKTVQIATGSCLWWT